MEYIFDASQVDPSQGIEIWPDNTWVKVIASSHKAVGIRDKEGQGRLVWTLKAVEGPLAGKSQFLGMNLWIDDTNGAQRMAKGELSAMVWVTLGASQGRLNMARFEELENIPFYILSKHGYNSNTKSQSQDWGGYKDINGVDAGKQQPGGGGGAPQFAGAPAGGPGFQQQPAAPMQQQGGFPGQQQQPAAAGPGFGAPPAGAPAPGFGGPAPGFGGGAPAPGPGFAPAGAPAFGAPPATSAAPGFAGAPAQQFQQPQQQGGFPQQAPAGGGFAPPPGNAPAGTPPWGAR